MNTYHAYEVMFIAMNCRYQANELVIIAMKDPFHNENTIGDGGSTAL